MAEGSSREDKIQGLKQIGWLKISSPSAIRIARTALSSGSADVQVEAANALKHLCPVAQVAVPDLRDSVYSGSEKLRVAASEALLTIEPDELDSLMPFLWKRDPKLANHLEILRKLSRL
jgi:HEAT repeat protein